MKFYFASRIKNKEKLLKFSKILEKNNHKVVSSWMNVGSLKPYSENQQQSRAMAKKIEGDIKKCDIFVLISDKAGTDMFVELGIAISLKKKIYIVGKWNKRSLMHFHPHVKHVDALNTLFKN